ncbi:MAG: hypothetical protein PVH61_05020 [Candidatus Aminicenantes bacterium]|jgi:hypothetical protein
MRRQIFTWLLAISLCWAVGDKIFAQEILLDQGMKAGKLDCFPVYGDEKTYYYLPANPRLATRDGMPQFSFLKYVQNVQRGEEGGTTKGEGGGLVHFLVLFGATEEERMEAEAELQEKVPGARLAGPVIYRSGTFALVTSFTDKNGDLAKEVVGLGKAPIMEGHKAAVSIHLTKKGATLLWESFKTKTSQISITFEMEVKGFRNPYNATLIADWSRICKHQHIAAGLKYKWLGADIDVLMQEFKKNGSIKIDVKGQDAEMDKIWQKAQDKLMNIMFEKDNAINTLESLQKGNANFNNLDRAINMLEQDKKRAEKKGSSHPLPVAQNHSLSPRLYTGQAVSGASSSHDRCSPGNTSPVKVGGALPFWNLCTGLSPGNTASTADQEKVKKAQELFRKGLNYNKEKKYQEALKCFKEANNLKPSVIFQRHIKMAQTALEKKSTEGKTTGGKTSTKPQPQKPQPTKKQTPKKTSSKPTAKPGDQDKPKTAASPDSKEKKGSGSPGFAVIASYQLKKIKKSGSLKLNLNRWTPDSLCFRFDENIGGLDKYVNNEKFFRAVNTDDPVYKQREIVVMLDGQNSEDFKKFVNYVTVQIRKIHDNGQVTHDELKIDKQNFNKEGNKFMMLYGWNGDNDRVKWLTYQYKTRWSFHGGVYSEGEWKTTDDFVITVTPPHDYRGITLEADKQVFQDKNVRHASIKFYSDLYGKEMVQQVTLRTREDIFNKKLEYAHPGGDLDYEYEILWHLRGGVVLNSGRLKGSSDIIYCDELPGG